MTLSQWFWVFFK